MLPRLIVCTRPPALRCNVELTKPLQKNHDIFYNWLIKRINISWIFKIIDSLTEKTLHKVHIFWKATKFCEISTLFLSVSTVVKVRWRFRTIVWPSQNIWTLPTQTLFKFRYFTARNPSQNMYVLGSAIKNLGLFSKSHGDLRIEKMDF